MKDYSLKLTEEEVLFLKEIAMHPKMHLMKQKKAILDNVESENIITNESVDKMTYHLNLNLKESNFSDSQELTFINYSVNCNKEIFLIAA